ncbi:hypothetical protein M758_UG274600 [Ceratodon purpureus]|nr:hypothetical protein M758_UG274600 [Ceratodon purpureus]
MDTPWDILRSCRLWFIWCQRCRHELNNKPFHLEAALLNAWRTTIHIDMEAASEIGKYKKSKCRIAMSNKLIEIWAQGNTFAKQGNQGIEWTLLPPDSWLRRTDFVQQVEAKISSESNSELGEPNTLEPQDIQLRASDQDQK